MSAKTLIFTFLGLALVGTIGAAADRRPPAEPLRPYSVCLDPGQVRGWSRLGDSGLLVDAGRNRYHVEFDDRCGDLGSATSLDFDVHGVGADGRICGDRGDAVIPVQVTARSEACPIYRIRTVNGTRYRQLLQDHRMA